MESWFEEIEEKCNESLTRIEFVVNTKEKWSLVDAIYYTMTLVTTIGKFPKSFNLYFLKKLPTFIKNYQVS